VNIGRALETARNSLAGAEIEDAGLEAEILLRHVLKTDRARIYSESGNELDPGDAAEFQALIERRLKGEPSAYITGNREFYGLDFYVNSDVLIPRPETELLVETAISLGKENGYGTIADAGTGSGCIAICLALNLPDSRIFATDISASALEIARENAGRHGVQERITLLEGNLLEPLRESVDMITANLPYVRIDEMPDVNTLGYEPVSALDGGGDGLCSIRELCRQLPDRLNPGGAAVIETGMGQAGPVARLLSDLYPRAEINIYKDLAGIDRIVRVRLP
jgi:release factor glutamine methyltransferase